jgi:hypothetical protein
VPERAASLRPTGRLGLVFACAGAALCFAIVAGSAWGATRPAQPSPEPSSGPSRLWSQYPLSARPRPDRTSGESGSPARPAASRPARVPSPPTLDRPSRLRPFLVAAFGTSVFASAFLLALLAVTASNTATFHRFLAIRRARSVESRRAAPVKSSRAAPVESRRAPPLESWRAPPLESPRAPPSEMTVAASRHLVFVPTDGGYTLVEVEGEPPGVGSSLSGSDLSLGGRFKVSKVGPSPLPADSRRCVYLERW